MERVKIVYDEHGRLGEGALPFKVLLSASDEGSGYAARFPALCRASSRNDLRAHYGDAATEHFLVIYTRSGQDDSFLVPLPWREMSEQKREALVRLRTLLARERIVVRALCITPFSILLSFYEVPPSAH